ncbi:MAG: hypothetical protein H7256_15200 [Bdellovibrio sp.]|nr:hypothetical protein [Bdellovibrio sp.]
MFRNSFFTFVTGFCFTTQLLAQVAKPVFPGYTSCPVSNNVINTNCIADVNRRYNASLDAYYRSLSLVTNSYTGTVAPVKPPYSCTVGTDGVRDNVCENNYANQLNNYNLQQNAYQTIQSDQAAIAQQQQTAAQARLASVSATTATGTLAEITEKNKEASGTYSTASKLCMAASVVAAGAFAVSCSGGATCQYKYLYTSIAMAAFSALAAKQASSHDKSAADACVAQNQLSSTSVSCGTGSNASAYTPDSIQAQIGQIGQQIDTSTGQCKASAPASCVSLVTKANEAGIDVKGIASGVSQFAGANAPFKVNKDGTITTKDGKTFAAADFADEKAMIAAGMSPSDAKALASSLSAPGGVLANTGLDAKGDLKDLAKTDFGSFAAIGSSGGSGSGSGDVSSSSKSALGSKDLGGRKPSSNDQGLIRSFNGDSIGIANDDIFKMMNKRYKLKSAQDAFIGQ